MEIEAAIEASLAQQGIVLGSHEHRASPLHWEIHEDIISTWDHIYTMHGTYPCLKRDDLGQSVAESLANQHVALHTDKPVITSDVLHKETTTEYWCIELWVSHMNKWWSASSGSRYASQEAAERIASSCYLPTTKWRPVHVLETRTPMERTK